MFMKLILVLATLFTTSAAEKRLCLYCDHVAIPQDCTRVLRCGEHEDCFVDKFVTPDGLVYYSLGCRDFVQCTGAANSFGRRYVNESAITHETSPSLIEDTNLDDVGDTAYCRHCCNTGQICNVQNHCGSPEPHYFNGTICYKCDNLENPQNCHHITLCDQTEVCHLEQTINSFSKRILYNSGCKRSEERQCEKNDAELCCKTDFCNDHLACQVNITTKPKLSLPYEENGVHKFNCTFQSITNRHDITYEVTWLVDGKPLTNDKGYPIIYRAKYDKVGYLEINNLKGNLNKMLRCKVQAMCQGTNIESGEIYSNPYWVGIKVSPSKLSVHMQTLTIETTIPMISTDPSKGLPALQLQNEETGRNITNCRYRFKPATNGLGYSVDIPVVIKAHSLTKQSDTLVFKPLKDIYYPLWMNFKSPPVQISSYNTNAVDTLKTCKLKGDTLSIFDGKLNLNNTAATDLVLYRTNSKPFLEVQIKREACSKGMCTCAVVVKEGNDGIQIDVCGQTTDLVPVVTYLSHSSDETILRADSKDPLYIPLTVLSGANITVNMSGPENDMGITLSIDKNDIGKPGGICGNETWLYIPGFGNVGSIGGVTETETDFFNKWNVTLTENLFNSTLIYDPMLEQHISYCFCNAKNRTECGTTV